MEDRLLETHCFKSLRGIRHDTTNSSLLPRKADHNSSIEVSHINHGLIDTSTTVSIRGVTLVRTVAMVVQEQVLQTASHLEMHEHHRIVCPCKYMIMCKLTG
jgi:hypothetical protein